MFRELAVKILDPIFNPLIKLGPFYVLLIISFIISLLSILSQKYFSNQKRMKEIKKEMTKLQKKIRATKDQKEILKLHKKIMPLQLELMKESFKPTIYTIIPFLIIFFWLSANIAYQPLESNQPFNITFPEPVFISNNDGLFFLINNTFLQLNNKSNNSLEKIFVNKTITLKGESGVHKLLVFNNNDKKEIIFSIGNQTNFSFLFNNKKIIFSLKPQKIKILGFNLSWLWAYIIFALIFSLILKKIFNVV